MRIYVAGPGVIHVETFVDLWEEIALMASADLAKAIHAGLRVIKRACSLRGSSPVMLVLDALLADELRVLYERTL